MAYVLALLLLLLMVADGGIDECSVLSLRARALSILSKSTGGMTAKSFVKEWFDRENPVWTRMKNGVSCAGAWLWAGSHLSKLKKRGLVGTGKDIRRYTITPAGRAIISD